MVKQDEEEGSDDDDELDPIIRRKKADMKRIILTKRAEFKFSASDALWGLICCKDIFNRDTMRDSVFNRKVLNLNKGVEKMNKELDIGNVLKLLRRFNFFYKTMLDKN